MEIVPATYYENLKKYWRKRKYQRLHGGSNQSKRKLLITRLGDGGGSRRRQWKMRSCKPKLTMMVGLRRVLSPAKLLAKFHETYVDLMIRLAGNVASKSTGAGAFSGKKVAKTKQVAMASSGGGDGDLVDGRLLLEIYKRLAASREMVTY
ncbi:uncharacterized protein LOC133820905 [Humulus lupulus]|uniref:uncharacterized protein LOC133820905 n=1 Tax=Humulus lupulus TaxID=3486 RepID=UPI002B40912B|nr:uncharacterized protein LOC133820905 [Humulus lupulus]